MNVRVGASKSPAEVPQSLPGSQGSAGSFLAAALRTHPYPLWIEPTQPKIESAESLDPADSDDER